MATQRLLRLSRGPVHFGDTRQADSLVQIISILGARRRELKASVGQRLRVVVARCAAAESRHAELEARLAGAEGHLERLDRARAAEAQRRGRRRERIVQLKQLLEMLRPASAPPPAGASMYQLGSVLMYVGGLLVLWVVLLELGLALGLT